MNARVFCFSARLSLPCLARMRDARDNSRIASLFPVAAHTFHPRRACAFARGSLDGRPYQAFGSSPAFFGNDPNGSIPASAAGSPQAEALIFSQSGASAVMEQALVVPPTEEETPLWTSESQSVPNVYLCPAKCFEVYLLFT